MIDKSVWWPAEDDAGRVATCRVHQSRARREKQGIANDKLIDASANTSPFLGCDATLIASLQESENQLRLALAARAEEETKRLNLGQRLDLSAQATGG